MKTKIFAFLTVLVLLCMGLNIESRADDPEYDPNWVDWSTHSLTSPENCVYGYQKWQVSGQWEQPQYCLYLDDASKGVIVRQVMPQGNYAYPRYRYYYFSKVNTATIQQENRATQNVTTNSMAKISSNNAIIDSDFRTYFPNWADLYCFTSSIINDNSSVNNYYFTDNYDISCTSSLDLYNQLVELDFQNPDSGQSGDNVLPLLSYSLERKTVPQASLNLTTTKLVFTWDYTEKEPYASNPSNYTLDIMACANWKNSPNGIGQIYDADNLSVNQDNQTFISLGGQNVSVNNYSFLYDSIGKTVYSKSNVTWWDDSINSMTLGYNLYIRTKTYDGTKTSYWKIFKVQAGGYVRSTGMVMKPDGTIVDGTQEGIEDSDDDLDTSNNGYAPYNPDNNTTAQDDTTGEMYNPDATFNIGTMIAQLKAIVNSILELPHILAQLLTFLPSWFITLLILSMGMFVVIGIVKTIVG